MRRGTALPLAFTSLLGLSVHLMAAAVEPISGPASTAEYVAVERFLSAIERPPVAHQSRRRLEASTTKLNESAWLEAVTQYDPQAGFRYSIVALGGSERIQRRVLMPVLEAEKETSAHEEW